MFYILKKYDIILIVYKIIYKIREWMVFVMRNILLAPFKFILLILKVPFFIFKYFFIGFFYTASFIFKFIGMFFELVFKIFIYMSYLIYKFLYYLLIGIKVPFVFIHIKLILPLSKIIKKSEEIQLEKKTLNKIREIKRIEKDRLKKENIKNEKLMLALKKKEEEKKKQEEKLKIKESKNKKDSQKENEIINDEKNIHNSENSYINKNVKLEKTNFIDSLKKSFIKIKNIPKNIKDKIHNNSFAKNSRNKRDMNRQALLINFEGEDAIKSDTKLIYEYVAKNQEGKVVKGYFDAFSKVEVHSYLLSEGFEVYSIKTNKWITFLHGKSSVNRTKIKTKDLIFFLTQLSTYVKAGIPLVESLRILSRQYKNKNYQRIFKAIIYDLTMGENFSEALLKQNVAFPRLLINMVKTAEMTGELPEVLDDMANYYTEAEKTRKQMITALMYPSMVFVFAVGVITFIMMFVIPRFVEIYESMDASKIPAFTKFIISVSDFLQKYIVLVIIALFLFIVIFSFAYKKVKMFRTIMQWIAMHLPIFGNTIIYNEVTMFTKTFASLLAHNVFITDSMEVLNKITNNEIYKMLILDTITNLARGEKISAAFEGHWAFPIPAYEMLVTGEKTGELATMMQKVSEYYQELHKQQVARIKTFIEPLLTIFLTVVVGIIILAIVIPMFSMYQTIQQY